MKKTIAAIIAIIIPIGITNGSNQVSLNFFAIISSTIALTTATTSVIIESTPAPSPKVSGLPPPIIARAINAPIRPIKIAGVAKSFMKPPRPLFSFCRLQVHQYSL